MLLTTNLNANSTNNIIKNEIETIHLNEPNIQSNVQANMFSDYEEQVDRAEHVDNVLTENSDINNIQALAAVAAAANAKQLRNSVNEKRLLVKLIKATNLTSDWNFLFLIFVLLSYNHFKLNEKIAKSRT